MPCLGGRTTKQSFKSSMDHVFGLAREHDVRSIAILVVGTGIASLSIEKCARAMAGCLRDAFVDGWSPDEVRFVLFVEAAKETFEGPSYAALGVI